MKHLYLAIVLTFSLQSAALPFQPQNQLSDIELRSRVIRALRDGTSYLKARQARDGSWSEGAASLKPYTVGVTSLTLLSLINCDVPLDSVTVQRGLKFLRELPPNEPRYVYEASLMIMALCAADDIETDRDRILRLTRLLEVTQADKGKNSGLWGYYLATRGGGEGGGRGDEDRSNGQYAVLALRDAANAGIAVDRKVWQRTHDHWVTTQNTDGGWGYRPADNSSGSMTTAGLSTVAITSRMIQDDADVDASGRPDCCTAHPLPDVLKKGRQWMAQNFSVYTNPKFPVAHYYYLYGLERAGRLGHNRFYGQHDWYREGARYLVDAQNGDGSWKESAQYGPVVSSTFAMLFLSKGLSRVVVNKLDYTSVGNSETTDGDWNHHPLDIPNLVEHVDGLKGWPPRLTSQVLSLNRLSEETAVVDMNQAPVLFLSGKDAPTLTDQHVKWLRAYIDEGGFIFAVSNCQGGTFDAGFRDLIPRMFPDGDASLQRLQADHPVFRSEYPLLNADGIELLGVDFGCRTSIIYSPEDLGCLWQKWMKHDPQNRSKNLIQRIIRAEKVGINVLAYATGREPPVKLKDAAESRQNEESRINRGLTEIAQLRHTGGWDTAPKALQNLLRALNKTTGMGVSPNRQTIPITFDELRRFPLAYMHGRYQFQLAAQERDALRDYLSRGAMLFADACCGSPKFDDSFRELMQEMFPDQELKTIPVDHELYSPQTGHDLREVSLRTLVPGDRNASMQTRVRKGSPLLEGIEIDGRYVVIYSRYDISCALENQASLACDGYIEGDAMKLATNVVLYAMLQDISWSRYFSQPRSQ